MQHFSCCLWLRQREKLSNLAKISILRGSQKERLNDSKFDILIKRGVSPSLMWIDGWNGALHPWCCEICPVDFIDNCCAGFIIKHNQKPIKKKKKIKHAWYVSVSENSFMDQEQLLFKVLYSFCRVCSADPGMESRPVCPISFRGLLTVSVR